MTEAAIEKHMKLVEDCEGSGRVSFADRIFDGIDYRVSRFQGMALSGLPIPGVHRIEGNLDLSSAAEAADLIGQRLTLELEDGRTLVLTLADAQGRVLAEGHGPSRCTCC